MYKNLIIVTISCVIGLFLCYIIGVSYYYININKDRPYHFKNTKSLEFHKKYTSKIHHLSGLNWDKKNEIPENFLFTVVNNFQNKDYKILIQGDSYVETLTYHNKSFDLLKKFSKKNNVGLINAGVGSYSPSLMKLQLDILEKDFKIYPNIIVAYFDQSDVGDEICRYKDKRKFNNKNQLIAIEEEKYSRNVFNYTRLHYESSILLSNKSDLGKSISLFNFNLKYFFMKRVTKISEKIIAINKEGLKGRKLKKECYWEDIERPIIENNHNEMKYFKKVVKNYLEKIATKNHVEKIFIITFPHKANLYPLKNQFDQTIYYNVNLADVIDEVIAEKDNIQHLNFTKEIKGKEKYFYDNAYIDFDPHLKEDFHYSLFAKKIVEKLNKYLNQN